MARTIRLLTALFALASLLGFVSPPVQAKPPAVQPEALEQLRRMTDYVASLKRFSLETEGSFEEVLASGQKLEYAFDSRLLIRRPDRLRAERTGDGIEQVMVYDGATLSIDDRAAGYHAVAEAPDDIDGLLHFARDSLGIVPPSGDLVFSDAFELLTASVTSGMVVGRSIVGDVPCVHLAFRSTFVDWQIWIAEGDRPFPLQYVLTTTNDPAQPQYRLRLRNWNTKPKANDKQFELSAPKASKRIDFLRIDAGPRFTP